MITLINCFPSRRVKVDGNVWRFDNASSIARNALSLSPFNFDMLVTGYCLIIVRRGLVRLGVLAWCPCLFCYFCCWCHVYFNWYRFREATVAGSLVGIAFSPRAEGLRFDSLPSVVFYSCRFRGCSSHLSYINVNTEKQRKPIYTVVSIRRC